MNPCTCLNETFGQNDTRHIVASCTSNDNEQTNQNSAVTGIARHIKQVQYQHHGSYDYLRLVKMLYRLHAASNLQVTCE